MLLLNEHFVDLANQQGARSFNLQLVINLVSKIENTWEIDNQIPKFWSYVYHEILHKNGNTRAIAMWDAMLPRSVIDKKIECYLWVSDPFVGVVSGLPSWLLQIVSFGFPFSHWMKSMSGVLFAGNK